MVKMVFGDSFILDEVILRALSIIPTLQVLTGGTIRLGTSEVLNFGDGFCALGSLTLKGASTDLCTVLNDLPRSKLYSLTLSFTNSDGQFAAVAAHLPDTLTQYASTFCAPLGSDPMAVMDLIKPLLSKMPMLDDFRVVAEKSALSVANDDLILLGDAWPHLTRLTIRQCTTGPRSNLPDARRPLNVSGLAELARRCPKLTMLSLPELDASKPAEPRPAPFLGHRLKQLCFQGASSAPARALNEAAVAINIMFPHLELHEMQPRAKCPAKVDAAWAHIWNTLEIMRWGRRDYILSERGCESAVPEVPEMASDL
ncbi:hypothetical protein GSI_04856 [Ganoderma sinense ZZ0214-1]|uniref:Uncharacterized protein n=1 Tax=Ganoderma sinense ZZ0214-1 TaxID=1077348 RepID=A0A2G8SG67_9APHY|nr:hypothetical protein GSI_04856 [Ganoderma sinense ZZ0214-1]